MDMAERDRLIVDRLRGGARVMHVAREFGLTRQRVQQIMRRAGMPRRTVGSGPESASWRGGWGIDSVGYVRISTGAGTFEREHRIVAARALGRPLPPAAVVHHVNGDKTDNRPANLVVCEDQAYHLLIEQRTRALNECGHADWIRCGYCGVHAAPDSPGLYIRKNGKGYHRQCELEYQRARRAA